MKMDRVVPGRSAMLGALPIVMALVLSGVISFSYNRLLKSYRDAVDHSFEVRSTIDNALLRLEDAETGQRGYIITGDEDYLLPFEAGRAIIFAVLSDLGELTADNSEQQARAIHLRGLAQSKLAELDDTITVRRRDGFEPARANVLGNSGKKAMDQIRSVAAQMRTAEGSLLDARISSARFAERMMIGVAAICVALSILGRLIALLIAARERTKSP